MVSKPQAKNSKNITTNAWYNDGFWRLNNCKQETLNEMETTCNQLTGKLPHKDLLGPLLIMRPTILFDPIGRRLQRRTRFCFNHSFQKDTESRWALDSITIMRSLVENVFKTSMVSIHSSKFSGRISFVDLFALILKSVDHKKFGLGKNHFIQDCSDKKGILLRVFVCLLRMSVSGCSSIWIAVVSVTVLHDLPANNQFRCTKHCLFDRPLFTPVTGCMHVHSHRKHAKCI